MGELVVQEIIENMIYLIRGHKVMIDKDLAMLYEVRTKNLNKAIKRNINRFPEDFMFQLTADEFESLRFQFGTSRQGRGGRRYAPYVFTEHGVAMLSSVLNSERAISINIAIMRTFAKLRHMLATHKDLAEKIDKLENKTKKHDEDILIIFEAIRQLMEPPAPPKPKIGFHP